MKTRLTFIALLVSGALFAQSSKTPIYNGILQTNLDANHFKVTNADFSDYAGAGITWDGNKFTTAGGGVGEPSGADRTYQFNNAGGFGSVPSMTYDGTIPATATRTPAANTSVPALLLRNPATATSGAQQFPPSLNFKGSSWNTGTGTHSNEWRLSVQSQNAADSFTGLPVSLLAFQHSEDGGTFDNQYVYVDSHGNIGANGDSFCAFATMIALDAFKAGNPPIYASMEPNGPWGSLALADHPTSGIGRITWSDSNTYYDGGHDLSVGRAGVSELGIYTCPTCSTLGALRINTQTAGDNSTKAATTAYVDRGRGVTVATLPTPAILGMVASVTDGASALAWGVTVTGGGTTKYLVWYNGTNWTVIGK